MRRLGVCLIMVCAILGCAARAARAQVPIAVVGPMTGQNAPFGRQFVLGVRQAVDDLNAAGGVLGQQITLEQGDDACDPRQAVSVANQVAGRGVKLVVGHFCSGSSIPASRVYTEEGVLQISPGSTNPDYTDHGDWNTFRTCGRDDQQGAFAGAWLAEHAKDKRIAILDDNSAYGRGLAEQTRRALQAHGGHSTLDASYTAGEHDYLALVSRLKAAGIDVIYVGGYYPETGLIARQAAEQGMHPLIIGGDALVTNEYWQIAQDAGEGTMMTFAADPRRRPDAAKVVAEFTARHIDPEGYVLYSYAAVQVWAEAAKQAGSVDPEKVAKVLHSGTPFPSVIGPIAFDAKGDPKTSSYVFYVWNKGTYHQM
jgi:branched-chain amino acid transport system substrate-binding protein